MANLVKMSYQDIFDKVAKHLLTQGERSESGFIGCVYRTPNGMKCAIGCLIDDEIYTPEIEGKSVDQLSIFTNLSEKKRDLLIFLQMVHDDYSVKEWSHELGRVASMFDLSNMIVEKYS